MAGNISGLHVFAADTGPEPLSLLDGVNSTFETALNTLSTFSNYYVDTGGVNALNVTVGVNQEVSLTDGLMLQIQVANTTTSTTPTLDVGSLGAKTIVTANNGALPAGALVAGMYIIVLYDATNNVFRLVSQSSTLLGTFPSGTAAAPGVAFTTDTSTGLYLPGVGQLGFASDGVARGSISATGAWTILAPGVAAAVALTINSASNQEGLLVQGGGVTNQSFGALIEGGTSTDDFSLQLQLHNETVMFQQQGDGQTYVYAPGVGTVGPTGCFQVGFADWPQNEQTVTYELAITDRGKSVAMLTGAGQTLQIPANSSIAFPVGSVIHCFSGANSLSVTCGDTLQWLPTVATGTRAVAAHSPFTLYKVNATTWYIWSDLAGAIS